MSHFLGGFAIYLLFSPFLFLTGLMSLRYAFERYQASHKEKEAFLQSAPLRLMTKFTSLDHFVEFMNDPRGPRGDKGTRLVSIAFLCLAEAAFFQRILVTPESERFAALVSMCIWAAIYLLSFVVAWRLGHGLKNHITPL
jgi:ABC-type sugar transport system permease subunit